MRKASRLFEIIQILRLADRPTTAARIAERLEVTPRSIYRDIPWGWIDMSTDGLSRGRRVVLDPAQ